MMISIFSASSRSRGFTLVEIMVVVVIIGLLAALAMQGYTRIHNVSLGARFVSDLRTFSDQFNIYSVENGHYPQDVGPGVIPPEMAGHLSTRWEEETVIGGLWDWDYEQFGYEAGVSVYQPGMSTERMQLLDGRLDDGDLDAGKFRQRAGGYIYIIEF